MKRLLPYEKICFPKQKAEKLTNTDGYSYYRMTGEFPGNTGCGVGIDPGVNWGLTIVRAPIIDVYWGKLPMTKEKGVYGREALELIWMMFEVFADWRNIPAVVEGAAYHSQFGQVGLEEVRAGFYIGLWQCGFKVKILPPATIRKIAFNDGKMQAGDVWPTLNHNGADSIAMALVAAGVR